jgi:hypothetical protein
VKKIVELWQNQPLLQKEIDMEMVINSATKFQRRIRRRNFLEYAGGAFVVAWAVYFALLTSAPLLEKVGLVLTGLGALVVVNVLRKRGRAGGDPPLDAPTLQIVAWHRAELARQRDLLRSVPLWYLGPLVPGVLVTFLGRWLVSPERAVSLASSLGVVVLVFGGVWVLNAVGAKQLERKIRELDENASH